MYSESIVVIQFKLIFLILYQNMQMVRWPVPQTRWCIERFAFR